MTRTEFWPRPQDLRSSGKRCPWCTGPAPSGSSTLISRWVTRKISWSGLHGRFQGLHGDAAAPRQRSGQYGEKPSGPARARTGRFKVLRFHNLLLSGDVEKGKRRGVRPSLPVLLRCRLRRRAGLLRLSLRPDVQLHGVVDLLRDRGSAPAPPCPSTQSLVTTAFTTVWSEGMSYMICVSSPSITARRPRAPMLRSMALSAMASRASSVKFQVHVVVLHQLLVLLHQGVLRLRQNPHQILPLQSVQGRDHRQAAHQFRE